MGMTGVAIKQANESITNNTENPRFVHTKLPLWLFEERLLSISE